MSIFKISLLRDECLVALLLFAGCGTSRQLNIEPRNGSQFVIVYQPSHQTDTGKDFNEALVCNGIVEAAMAASTGVVKIHKVWSHDTEYERLFRG